jgi:hypothetical protein
MPQTCSRCSRVNPPGALFCYHDGASLGDASRGAAQDLARQRFLMPFVFPSGKACHTFDELVLGILDHWDDARDLLAEGVFSSYLGGLGRADLSRSARQAAAFPDRDRGLNQLVNQLPSEVLQPPRLAVEPGQLNLGTLRPGQDGRFEVHLHNQGMGLLLGTVSCEECPWLTLGDPAAGNRKKLVQLRHESALRVNVCGKSLRAGKGPQEGQLLIESTGGHAVVTVTLDVPIQPFPDGVLAGALTPRQVAEKAKRHPREAADLFARGAVARWYESNGWTYPVTEPSASGVAAVQQFFEALGLTRPPKVAVNVKNIRLEGSRGDSVRTLIQVASEEKRPVYAHAHTDQDWLVVSDVNLDGNIATVHLRVSTVPDRPGETLNARVTIIANGRQRFVVPVSLSVAGRAARSRSALPVAEAIPLRANDPVEVIPIAEPAAEEPRPRRRRERPREEAPCPEPQRGGAGRFVLAALPVVFLVVGLLAVLARDLGTWASAGVQPPGQPDGFGDTEQLLALAFHDTEEQIFLSPGGSVKPLGQIDPFVRPGVWEPSMRFGLSLFRPDRAGRRKKLTYKEKGTTNNTCLRIDGNEWLFGERPFRFPDGTYNGDWPGRWHAINAPLDRPLRDGRKSIWVYDEQQLMVTQTVGLVPGAQSGKLDTCLIHYRIDNKDQMAHQVGLRFLLDTFIGGNDGVPFLVPGEKQLCSTQMDINRSEDVPDFIQARETEDLSNPGTIAQVQLRLAGMEPPSRVTLGAWPHPKLGNGAMQEKTLWNVPVLPIKSVLPGDSAVVIYWAEKPLAPGASREVGFAYGLGNVSAGEGGGRLALTVGGAFVPNGEITLTAYVSSPVAGQKLSLFLPDDFTLVTGETTERVPAAPGSAVAPITWKVRAGPREGRFDIKVQSSTGASQTQMVQIAVRGIFGN